KFSELSNRKDILRSYEVCLLRSTNGTWLKRMLCYCSACTQKRRQYSRNQICTGADHMSPTPDTASYLTLRLLNTGNTFFGTQSLFDFLTKSASESAGESRPW